MGMEGTSRKFLKNRANTLRRYLRKIQHCLEEKNLILEIGTGKQSYSVHKKAPGGRPNDYEHQPGSVGPVRRSVAASRGTGYFGLPDAVSGA